MHFIIGFVTAVMVLFPASDSGGKSLYQLWMDAYEKYLYQQMYDNFERARNEQAAVEEAEAVPVVESVPEEVVEVLPESSAAEPADIRPEVDIPETQATTPLYQVDGYVPNEDLQTYLYNSLCSAGIGYFFPYAVCLIAQESTWNPLAQNPNGRDKGLLQFRVEYVPWMDWANPYQQIDYFTQLMANRAAAGRTVSEMISAHNQSDYGPYCQSYVDAVMQHAATLVQIR